MEFNVEEKMIYKNGQDEIVDGMLGYLKVTNSIISKFIDDENISIVEKIACCPGFDKHKELIWQLIQLRLIKIGKIDSHEVKLETRNDFSEIFIVTEYSE